MTLSTERSDPLRQLGEQIARARSMADQPRGLSVSSGDDPLSALGELIARARDLDEPLDVDAPEPLGSLLDTIRAARELPSVEPYRRDWGDPLAHLAEIIAAEIDAYAAIPNVLRSRSSRRAAPSVAAASGDSSAVVGRQVLALLAERPLDGRVRAKAVERLAAQIDDPDPAQLREILALLLGADI